MNPHAEASYPLTLVLHRDWQKSGPWRLPHWKVSGLLAEQPAAAETGLHYRTVQAGKDDDFYLWSGLTLDLYLDSLHSYYLNLIGAQPGLFVLCHDDHPQTGVAPVAISADWGDAEAHLETDGIVLSHALVSPWANWLADFVLQHQAALESQLQQGGKGKHGKRKQRHV